jgi:mannosyltransferase
VLRFDATTALLRPVDTPSRDLWDDLLRLAGRVEYVTTTQTLVRRWAYWLVPAMLTALITAIGLGRPGLWTDELATWGMATTPWSQFWPVLRYVDAVLAPYYAFMHGWVAIFGDSDIALRMPSSLAMAGAAALIAAIGHRLVGANAGLLAGVVFALLPSTSRFAAEARPYAFTVLAACAATWLLLRAWDRPSTPRWVGYAVAVAALGLLHMVGLLLIAAHAWAVLAWRREAWWRFAVAAAAGVAAILPMLVYGAQQRHQVAYIPPVSFSSFLTYGDVLFGGLALTLLVVGLALFSLPLRFPSAVFASWAVVPTAALVVVSLALPMFLPRYLVYTTPGWSLLAGVTLARLRPVWMVAAAVVLAAIAVPVQVQQRTAGGHDQATAQLGTLLAEQARPGDAIVYADDEPVGAWTARDAVAHYVPAAVRPHDVLATHPPRTDGLLLATECPDVATCIGDPERLWVVRIGNLTDPFAGIGAAKQDVLSRQYRVRQVWYPTGLTLALLQRNP